MLLYYILITEGIAAFRTELRRILGICRLPATLIAFILRNSCRFLCTALKAELALVECTA